LRHLYQLYFDEPSTLNKGYEQDPTYKSISQIFDESLHQVGQAWDHAGLKKIFASSSGTMLALIIFASSSGTDIMILKIFFTQSTAKL
jgi:hypothetical protein